VLRVAAPPPPAWDPLLPPEVRRLPDELARIDAYLDDERFITPWRALFSARLGRPSVPVQTLLRLLYLKHRYQLGYRTLCREVTDPGLLAAVLPHRPGPARATPDHPGPSWSAAPGPRRSTSSTMRCWQSWPANGSTLPQAAHRHHRRGGRHRHPTDADLLEHAVRTLGGLVRRVHARAAATHTPSVTAPAPPGAGSSRSPGPCGGAPGRPRRDRPTHRPGRGHRPTQPGPGRAGRPQRPPDAWPTSR
jgi:IS5 family transposase